MARLHWRGEKRKEDPDAFLVAFVGWIPNFDYNAYLSSEQWQGIRRRKMEAAEYKCKCCKRRATQVHHRDYRPRVLAGEDLSPLVALCHQCHNMVEYDDTGRKRDVWQDKERILAELTAGRGHLAPGRDKGWGELRKAGQLDRMGLPGAGIQGSVKVSGVPPADSAPDASDERRSAIRARQRDRQREYRRHKAEARRIQNEERRAKMSPYALGVEDATTHKSADETYNARPPDPCPFAKGTPEEAEYDRGWKDAMARYRR